MPLPTRGTALSPRSRRVRRGLGAFGIASVAAAASVVAVATVAIGAPDDVVGMWDTGDGAHVEIYTRDGKYHGKFVRFDDEPPNGGLDTENPDPQLRGRSLVGTDFIRHFEYEDDKWRHGRIYNPENGKLYKADLELKDGTLKVRGWIGVRLLGRTVEWTRTD